MSNSLHEHHREQCTPTVNPLPKFAHLSTRELVFLILAARNRGYTAAALIEAQGEILRRELGEAGDER